MGNFAVNLNRQFFVITKTSAEASVSAVLNGTAGSFITGAGTGSNANDVSITIKGASTPNTIKINKKCIDSITATRASKMARNLKSYKLSLNSNASESIIASLDYVLRVNFTGFSNEDTYIKDAAVHATKAMAAEGGLAKFYNALAVSLYKSFNRLYTPMVEITNGTTAVAGVKDVDGVATAVDASGSAVAFTTFIQFNEKDQTANWSADTNPILNVDFKVIPTNIMVDGDEVVWGKVTDNTTTYNRTVKNGYKTAELEWFCMGERADMYRTVGYPKTIKTTYMVNPTAEYDYLDIQYHYSGNSEDSMKSPKHVTIVATAGASALNTGLSAIQSALS